MELIRAELKDAEKILAMQRAAFWELYQRYQDTQTNPAMETLDRMQGRFKYPFLYYYLIRENGQDIGAVRIYDEKEEGKDKVLSSIFILPSYRNQGFAQKAIRQVEKIHGTAHWKLDTIGEEKGNCYLYEKMGYRRTGETEKINDKMTLVFFRKE